MKKGNASGGNLNTNRFPHDYHFMHNKMAPNKHTIISTIIQVDGKIERRIAQKNEPRIKFRLRNYDRLN